MVQEARIDRRLKLVPFAGSQYCFVVVRVRGYGLFFLRSFLHVVDEKNLFVLLNM